METPGRCLFDQLETTRRMLWKTAPVENSIRCFWGETPRFCCGNAEVVENRPQLGVVLPHVDGKRAMGGIKRAVFSGQWCCGNLQKHAAFDIFRRDLFFRHASTPTQKTARVGRVSFNFRKRPASHKKKAPRFRLRCCFLPRRETTCPEK